MKSTALGTTGLAMSEMGLGGSAIGNMARVLPNQDANEAVATAWDLGVRYFDTAPHYGLGLSERRMGAALKGRPRDEFVLSTKVGRLLVPNEEGSDLQDPEGFAVPATHRRVYDLSRDGVRRSVEESLQRLGLDRIDILYMHDPDDHWSEAIEQGFPALAELRAEGVVSAIGAGMNQSEMLAAFVRETDIDVVMLAGRYTLLEQGALDDLLPLCLDRHVAVVNVGVFNSGLLSKDNPQPGMMYNYQSAPEHLVQRAMRLAEICRRHHVSLPQAAIQFGRAHPAVISTVMGAGTAQRVRHNVDLFDAPIPLALWEELQVEGLLRADAPLPGQQAG